jgi:hypothetical protein
VAFISLLICLAVLGSMKETRCNRHHLKEKASWSSRVDLMNCGISSPGLRWAIEIPDSETLFKDY